MAKFDEGTLHTRDEVRRAKARREENDETRKAMSARLVREEAHSRVAVQCSWLATHDLQSACQATNGRLMARVSDMNR